jgi:UDP-N-acetylmuramoylalanine-D-glutamate ligase
MRSLRPEVPDGPYLVVGLGSAGTAAAAALAARSGAGTVRAWDDSRNEAVRAAAPVALARDHAEALSGVRAVIKSPGVDLDHPLLARARDGGLPVIDELELGWRLTKRPMVAVTGTNGKSTTATLVAAALEAGGGDPTLCGNTFGGPALSAVPPGGAWLVAEVSSYQAEACPELLPEAAVFTNLTLDHLHRHGTMEAYAASKRRLFVRDDRAVALAVVNADDPFGRRLAAEVGERGGRALTYGSERSADYRVRDVSWSARAGEAIVETPSGEVSLASRLPGPHNAENLTAALALADGLGLPRPATLGALAATPAPAGRFELVDAGQPFDVVVDYAHTPDSIERALATARGVIGEGGRLIVVLGLIARGDRDFRGRAGRAARAGSDHLILCGSSGGGEPPMVALSRALAGAREAGGGELEVVLDRRGAIERGLAMARPGDVVAILGRGPFAWMAFDRFGGGERFSDLEVARELLRAGRA